MHISNVFLVEFTSSPDSIGVYYSGFSSLGFACPSLARDQYHVIMAETSYR